MDGTGTGALSEDLSGLRVVMDDQGEPTLLRPEGTAVDTWREGYPYPERMTRAEYDVQKRRLQVELLKLQNWVKDSGEKLVVVFEGRDAAGKGGTIKRFTEHLYTHTADAPWTVVKSNDKKRARLEAMRHVLHRMPYEDRDPEVVTVPDPLLVGSASEVFEDEDRSGPLFPTV